MKKFIFNLLIIGYLLVPIKVMAYSTYIIPGGENIGIEVHNNGIMIVGFYKVNGNYTNKDLKAGDSIIKVNNIDVNSTSELVSTIDKNIKNNKVNITYLRDGKEYNSNLNVVLFDGVYKTGLYVKDSLSGIGTISYIDPNTKIYGALGHEILEGSTNKRIEVKTGNIYESYVLKINKSIDGNPGAKRAKIIYDKELGSIIKNTNVGIYGVYEKELPNKELLEVASLDEVHEGIAYISTVIKGNEIKKYKIDITRIDKNNIIKNFYFKIVDEELIDATGGVVQGMSGSPIIQDDKIIGAITHVIIDDVKTGYGISIVTMLEEGEK